jgi:hypothetical protein
MFGWVNAPLTSPRTPSLPRRGVHFLRVACDGRTQEGTHPPTLDTLIMARTRVYNLHKLHKFPSHGFPTAKKTVGNLRFSLADIPRAWGYSAELHTNLPDHSAQNGAVDTH